MTEQDPRPQSPLGDIAERIAERAANPIGTVPLEQWDGKPIGAVPLGEYDRNRLSVGRMSL